MAPQSASRIFQFIRRHTFGSLHIFRIGLSFQQHAVSYHDRMRPFNGYGDMREGRLCWHWMVRWGCWCSCPLAHTHVGLSVQVWAVWFITDCRVTMMLEERFCFFALHQVLRELFSLSWRGSINWNIVYVFFASQPRSLSDNDLDLAGMLLPRPGFHSCRAHCVHGLSIFHTSYVQVYW